LLIALRGYEVNNEKARDLKKQLKVTTPSQISSEIDRIRNLLRKGNKILKQKRFKKLIKHVNDEAEFFSRYKKAKQSNLEYVEIEQPQAHASFWKNIWEVPQNVEPSKLEDAINECRFSKHSTRLTHSPLKVEEVEKALTFTAP
jgi:hypothetical protein